jgi:hypothetical protein
MDRRRGERHASFERGDCVIDACNNKQSVGLDPSFELANVAPRPKRCER